MKVILVLSLIVLSSAARDIFTTETDYRNPDSEPEFPFLREGTFLPEENPTDDYNDANENKTYRPTILEIIIGRPMQSPFMFPWRPMMPMRPLFPGRPIFDFGYDDEYDDNNRTTDDFVTDDFLPDFFSPSFGGPKVKDLPPNYQNSTYEVKDINGSKVHVNQTINKKSGDGFDSFFHFKVIQVVPDNSTIQERPFDRIPEETTSKTVANPEVEIPENVDDSLNQLDSKILKSSRGEDIEVRKEVSL